jgi:hypothetical protein
MNLYMFRVLLAHLQEAPNKRHLVYCTMSVGCTSVPGSSVGIATDYGLNGPGIESGWGRDFSHMSRPALGPTQPPVQPGFSRG